MRPQYERKIISNNNHFVLYDNPPALIWRFNEKNAKFLMKRLISSGGKSMQKKQA